MFVHMCVCAHVYMCAYVCVRESLRVCACECVHARAYVCVCVSEAGYQLEPPCDYLEQRTLMTADLTVHWVTCVSVPCLCCVLVVLRLLGGHCSWLDVDRDGRVALVSPKHCLLRRGTVLHLPAELMTDTFTDRFTDRLCDCKLTPIHPLTVPR